MVALAVAVGGLVQGSIGFGFALVAVPALAVADPGALPVAALVVAVPMTVAMAVRERHHVDLHGVGWILAGRLVGTSAGIWILSSVTSGRLQTVVGAMILAAAGVSAVGVNVRPTRAVNVVAGVFSGVMGTTSAIGGPALAVVYQRRSGPELRSTLAVSFVLGLAISLTALALAGRVHRHDVMLGLALVPALAVGLLLSGQLVRRLDARWLRPVVLAFAGAAGLVLIVRGLS